MWLVYYAFLVPWLLDIAFTAGLVFLAIGLVLNGKRRKAAKPVLIISAVFFGIWALLLILFAILSRFASVYL